MNEALVGAVQQRSAQHFALQPRYLQGAGPTMVHAVCQSGMDIL